MRWLLGLAIKNAVSEDDRGRMMKLQRQIQMVVLHDSQLPITLAGPRLFKYRKWISEGNAKFFLDADFEEDIDESDSKKSTVAPIIRCIKDAWPRLDTEMRKKVFRRVQLMLSNHIKYGIALKEKAKNSSRLG